MDAALHYAGLVHERVSIRDCGAADQAHAPKAVPNLRLLASLNQALGQKARLAITGAIGLRMAHALIAMVQPDLAVAIRRV